MDRRDYSDGKQEETGEKSLIGLAAWLPRRLLLAIDLMVDIAFNGSGNPISAMTLGVTQGLEARKLETILQRLSRAGLLRSIRGPSGGYLLSREKGVITVADIAAAMLDGEVPAVFEKSPSPTMRAVVLPLVGLLHNAMMMEMARISLADLCQQCRLAGLSGRADELIDFVI